MQSTRRTARETKRAARALMDGSMTKKQRVRSAAELARDKANSKALRAQYAQSQAEARRVEAARSLEATESVLAQIALAPDYRPGVEAMRARIAKECGKLQPYTHKQGWTL